MTWLSPARAELAEERILDAAAELFARDGVNSPGMDEIARAAGCSRTTLYRYFENRRALHHAFAVREAMSVVEVVHAQTADVTDRRAHFVEWVVAVLAEVRSRPYLSAWYEGDSRILREILEESPLIAAFASDHLRSGEDELDRDLATWVLRNILSFLAAPGENLDEERRMIDRFLAHDVRRALTREG